MRSLNHEQYEVGWICALHSELAAAKAMLDERHDSLPQDKHDDNAYSLGSIGKHNVVIACLPDGEYGTNSAAHVASQMRLSFKSIRFGLMVGIAGGVPNSDKKKDVQLGDIVVSRPNNNNGGVLQYDMGRAVPGGFKITGFLNSPPQLLRTAITALRAEHRLQDGSKISEYLLPTNTKLPNEFAYPVNERDELFKPEYTHVGNKTCAECDRANLVRGEPRGPNPAIRYGTIASGNQVMQDAIIRDALAKQHKIICFEMEAAGLMNWFPCIVIRGICDYSDSHKNSQWQDYAAATAAAYAKELLRFIPDDIPTMEAATPPSASSSQTTLTQNVTEHDEGRPTALTILHLSFFTLEELVLGRLVTNIQSPAQDFWPIPPAQVAIPAQWLTRRSLENVQQYVGKRNTWKSALSRLFSLDGSRRYERDFNFQASETTLYTLSHPTEYFKQICDDPKARFWIEEANQDTPVFLVVGLITLKDTTITSSNTSSFFAAGERIVGLQYRKLRFSLFYSHENRRPRLGSSQWEMSFGNVRFGGTEQMIEVGLVDEMQVEDLELSMTDWDVESDDFVILH
jgi:nucleoside phosphorylase